MFGSVSSRATIILQITTETTKDGDGCLISLLEITKIHRGCDHYCLFPYISLSSGKSTGDKNRCVDC